MESSTTMNPFVQSPCTRCGTTVWVPTATGVGYCPQCHNPTQMPAGGAQGAIPPTMAIPAMSSGPMSLPGGASPSGASPWGASPAPQAPSGQQFGGGFGNAPAAGGFGSPSGGNPFGQAPQQGGAYGQAPQPQVGGYGPPSGGGYGQSPMGNPYGQPAGGFGGYPMPAASGGRWKSIIAGLGAIGVACGVGVTSMVFSKYKGGRGRSSLSSYSIDERAADPDAMIRTAGDLARGWRSDAVFSSINVLGFRTSGTVDLSSSSHTATVEYFSPSRVSSYLDRDRSDSIKKYTFTQSGISYGTMWGVRRRVERPAPTPTPTCTFRQLGGVLAAQGVPATAEMQVQYDPQFAFVVNGALAYHVTSSSPPIDRWYDVGSCTFLRGR